MKLVLLLIALALLARIVFDFLRAYIPAPGTIWQKLLAAGKASATILWARFVMLVGLASAGLVNLADFANAPGIADGIKAVMQPQYVAWLVFGIALVTELARRRTL